MRPLLLDAKKQIRLLQLQLDKKRGGGKVVRCNMSAHYLDEMAGQYVAVSYTWGDTGDTRTIIVNGQRYSVRFSCWQALKQLKLHGIGEYCFVDSICIDQGSHREKAKQVGQMDNILSSQARSSLYRA